MTALPDGGVLVTAPRRFGIGPMVGSAFPCFTRAQAACTSGTGAYLIFALYNTGEYIWRMRRLRAVFRESYPVLSTEGLDWAFVPRSAIAPLSELGEYLDSDPSRPATIKPWTAAAYVLVPAFTFCLAAGFVVYCYVELWNASPATVAGRRGEPVDLVNGVYWISAAARRHRLSASASPSCHPATLDCCSRELRVPS